MKTEHEAQTETPRTDEAKRRFSTGGVPASFASTLERELTAERQQIAEDAFKFEARIAVLVEEWNDEHSQAVAARAEVAALTAERDRLKEQVAEWEQKDRQQAEDEAGEDL